jgi:hypothetical protein
MDEVCRLLGITKYKLRPTGPRQTTSWSVFTGPSITYCKIIVVENQKNWISQLPFVVTAYNAAINKSTQCSPYYFLYGRPYRTLLDVTLNLSEGTPFTCERLCATITRENSKNLHRSEATTRYLYRKDERPIHPTCRRSAIHSRLLRVVLLSATNGEAKSAVVPPV